MKNKTKVLAACLTVSAGFFAALIQYEGFSSKPYRDSVGVPTVGIGTTQYPNGQRVKMTDAPVTKDEAVEYARAHLSKDERRFRDSLPNVALSQDEYDIYLDFMYNFGAANWQKSSMRRHLLAGNHKAACQSLLRWKYAGGKDCSIRKNGCYGVWKRQLDRHARCTAAN